MKKCFFVVFLICVSVVFLPVVGTAAPTDDDQAITVTAVIEIVGEKFKETTVNPTTETSVTGNIVSRETANDRSCNYAARRDRELKFDPPATVAIVTRDGTKNIFGWDCLVSGLLEGDVATFAGEKRNVTSITPKAGWTLTVTWTITLAPEPEAVTPTEAENKPYVNPHLVEGQIVFSIQGIGRMENIHGHIMPSFENTAPIIIQPRADYLGAFDLLLTRWSGVDGKELMLYSIPVATWRRNETSFDATYTGAAEYCINWLDQDSLMLCDPGPFPEFQITGADRGYETKTFFAIWEWADDQHQVGQWTWLF